MVSDYGTCSCKSCDLLQTSFCFSTKYAEISSTFSGNSGLAYLVRWVKMLTPPWSWMGFDPANPLWSKGYFILKWGHA